MKRKYFGIPRGVWTGLVLMVVALPVLFLSKYWEGALALSPFLLVCGFAVAFWNILDWSAGR
jgi:hypothetical protein